MEAGPRDGPRPGWGPALWAPPPPAPLLLSSPVLAAEVVKFFFPAMVQLHSYVPASSTPQKLANWGHLNRYWVGRQPCSPLTGSTVLPCRVSPLVLAGDPASWDLAEGATGRGCLLPCTPGCSFGSSFRKVLSKLNFSIPEDVIRQVVQCRPGMVEQVLLLLRQKIEEKQKQSKVVPGPGQVSGAWGKGAAGVPHPACRCHG